MSNQSVNIRVATHQDLPTLLQLGYEMYLVEKEFEPFLAFSQQEAAQRYSAEINDPRFLFLVVEVNGTIAGYLYAHLDRLDYLDTEQPSCEIEVIYLRPEIRGHGVAESLIQKAIAWAQKAGAWRVTAGIFLENTASLNAFTKAGFMQHHVTTVLTLPRE